MDLGIMWIFVGAIAVVFALAWYGDRRSKQVAARYRTDYEHSLKVQQDMLELLREFVALQREMSKRLEAIHQSLQSSHSGRGE